MKPRRAFNQLTKSVFIPWSVLGLFFLIGGCAIVQSGGEVQSGRADLFAGRPEDALVHFRRAAELNPDYVTGFTVFIKCNVTLDAVENPTAAPYLEI